MSHDLHCIRIKRLALFLSQLLCQVLNRMSSQTSCFQHVVLLEIPDLESVDHFPILAAVIGILLALLEREMFTFAGKYYNLTKRNPVCHVSSSVS